MPQVALLCDSTSTSSPEMPPGASGKDLPVTAQSPGIWWRVQPAFFCKLSRDLHFNRTNTTILCADPWPPSVGNPVKQLPSLIWVIFIGIVCGPVHVSNSHLVTSSLPHHLVALDLTPPSSGTNHVAMRCAIPQPRTNCLQVHQPHETRDPARTCARALAPQVPGSIASSCLARDAPPLCAHYLRGPGQAAFGPSQAHLAAANTAWRDSGSRCLTHRVGQ